MPSKLSVWYNKLVDFNVETLFSRKREPGPPRTVFVNEPLPEDYYDHKHRVKKEHVYCSNQVITSKYTVLTFVPRNLLEQFRRIANIFFLAIAILQFFSIFSTVSPGLVILPLIIVLAITALKDGYEDIKRHQSDRSVNYSQVRVLKGGEFRNENPMAGKSKTFVRGLVPNFKRANKKKGLSDSNVDILQHGAPPEGVHTQGAELEHIPTTTEEHGIEYDDGEPVEESGGLFHHHGASRKPHWKMTIWEDLRVGDIVKLMDDEPLPADILICATSEDENVAYVETKNLDGETNLKSRSACAALTHLNTARACADKHSTFRVECDRPETNLYRLNAAVVTPDGQKTAVDANMVLLRGTVLRNTQWVIGVVLYTGEDSKIVLNSGVTPSKRSRVERQMNPQVFTNLLLLAAMAVACGIVDAVLEQHYFPLDAPWLYGDTQGDDNPHINGLITWAFALITFQNIVPISLYISIEGVRTCQALFIYFDKEIFYEKTGQATLARSWNLSDDLGQIDYIFSDKTGTLTQNAMVFRQCTIAGRVYKGDAVDEAEGVVPVGIPEVDEGRPSDSKADVRTTSSASPPSAKKSSASSSSTEAIADPLSAGAVKKAEHVLAHFHDSTLAADITAAQEAVSGSGEDAHGQMLKGFWTVLALCHTALVSVDPHSGAIQYKAQSPDEAALVQAAADVGFVFRGRDREVLTLQTPLSGDAGGKYERYELLNILDFTSARKRMSVLVRKLGEDGEGDGKVYLLIKGADNVIMERLRPGQDELIRTTEDHLAEFASEGLRTLTLGYKVVPEAVYQSWVKRYHEATVSLDEREEKVEAVSDEIEHDLTLLGATAIEDRLQDGVPEAIADLKEAGIKVWVLTGDKLETAIAIGHSTNLIGREDNIVIIRGGGEGHTPVYMQMLNAVEEFFPESGILQEDGVGLDESTQTGGYPLQRINTGVSSLVGHNNGDRPGGFVLVIDGAALTYALADEKHKQLLLLLAMQCEGVICCRVSPLQKALVVKLVKDGVGAMTLAIGDGANDVSMIQAADVGVGISGEEGLQAVNSSDYAIAQFRFLKRLLLVHGHWSYARNGNMIINFFYKNIICIGVLWWFQIYCAWSSQYVFEYTYLLFWNTFWTIAPVIGIGLFDRIVDDHVLMAMPELYSHSRNHEYFGNKLFLTYMFDGIVQSAIIFFLVLYTYRSTSSRPDGYDIYQYEFSTTMAIAAVMAANLFNGLNTHVWTGWIFFAVALGIVLVWAYTAIYSVIAPGWFPTPIFGNDHYLFRSAYFWFSIVLVTVLALLPRYIAKAYKLVFAPSDLDRARWIHKIDPTHDFSKDRHGGLAEVSVSHRRKHSLGRHRPHLFHASRTDMSTGMRSVNRGFDFATEENGIAMQRMQSHLSERHQAAPAKRKRNASNLMQSFSIRRTLRRKKHGSQSSHPTDEPSSSPLHSPPPPATHPRS
ncbi:phospholipid-translocating P-type ATPase [Trametes meyenii]|nr:phospholipid-translocating P-type ATPase [Trametes meyenii]